MLMVAPNLITFVVCLFNKLLIGKKFICKVERLKDKTSHLDHADCKNLMLSLMAVTEIIGLTQLLQSSETGKSKQSKMSKIFKVALISFAHEQENGE